LSTIDLRHDTLAASSGLLATPALLWRGQSLPAASTPAPGPHTSRIGAGSLQRLRSASALSGLLRGFFGHRSGHLWDPTQAPGPTRVVLFQPRGLQDVRMSLSTKFCSRRSTAASLWSVRNPCVIQADSEPPGRLPPAPGSHIRRTTALAGGSFVSSGGVGLSSTFVDSRRISFVLTESQAMI
jgi:hypothetical protein